MRNLISDKNGYLSNRPDRRTHVQRNINLFSLLFSYSILTYSLMHVNTVLLSDIIIYSRKGCPYRSPYTLNSFQESYRCCTCIHRLCHTYFLIALVIVDFNVFWVLVGYSHKLEFRRWVRFFRAKRGEKFNCVVMFTFLWSFETHLEQIRNKTDLTIII